MKTAGKFFRAGLMLIGAWFIVHQLELVNRIARIPYHGIELDRSAEDGGWGKLRAILAGELNK